MLLRDDGDEDADPIAHEREEILKDLKQVVASGHGADEVDGDDEADPDVAGHSFAVAAEHLAAQRRGVGAGDVVADDAEGDDDAAEFAEAAEGAVAREDEGAGGDDVGVLPGWV